MRHEPEIRPGCPWHYHDTVSAFSYGCRCPKAREQWRLYNKRRRERRNQPGMAPAVGVWRRMEALATIGWPLCEQARRVGITRFNMSQLRSQDVVFATTAERVDAMYRELSMVPGPSQRARVTARNRGWAGPLCWDAATIDDPAAKPVGMPTYLDTVVPHDRLDEVVVERAIAGARVRMSRAEADAAVAQLAAKGISERDIADRLGITARSVARSKARLRTTEIRGAA